MAPSRLSLKRSLLLSTFLALSAFSAVALAQDTTGVTTSAMPKETTANAKTTAVTTGDTPTETGTGKATTSATDKKQSSATSQTSSDPTDLPGLSTSTKTTATGSESLLTGLPTLSKTVDSSIPTYPAPSPPPVGNAPFMNRSTLPDGTVFIAVGAILGLFGAAVLIWRGIVAFLLKRSVEKAAFAQHVTYDKAATFPAPPAPFYKYSNIDSSPSLAPGTVSSGRGQRRTTRGPIPSSTPSMTNLFFSPTAAGAGGNSSSGGNRESRFLPSGFYAATSASPQGQHGHSISLTNLGPGGRASHVGRTPPESPNLMPSRATPSAMGPGHNYSQSSISLNQPPGQRTPSAYLDDMLDEHPEAFPPQGLAPQPGSSYFRGVSGGQPPRF